MEARLTDPGRDACPRRRSCGAFAVIVTLPALLVLCGFAAPASADAFPAAGDLASTPLSATATSPTITITSPTVGGKYASGSLLPVAWTTGPAALADGQFRIRVGDGRGNYGSATYVNADGGTSYGALLTIDVPHESPVGSSLCAVYVDWRPKAGSGSWLSSGASAGSFEMDFHKLDHVDSWTTRRSFTQGASASVFCSSRFRCPFEMFKPMPVLPTL